MSKKTTLKLFSTVVDSIKELGLSPNLDRTEAAELSHITDELNDVADRYISRELTKLQGTAYDFSRETQQ